MKIAQVVCTFLPYQSGVTSVAYNLSLGLHERGHDVTVITPNYHNDIGPQPNLVFKISRSRPLFSYGNAAFLPGIVATLKKFDVVHLHYPFFGAVELIWLLRKFIPGKLILHYHNDPVVGRGLLGWFFSWYGRHITPRLARACDRTLFLRDNQLTDTAVKNLVAIDKIKYSILPNGVDFGIFYPRPADAFVLSKFNLPSESRVLLFVGGMSRAYFYKGVAHLLESFSILKKQLGYDKVFLLLAGDGELRVGYEKLAKELGIDNSVRFLGRLTQNDLAEIYNLSEALMLPSLSESFSMVLFEAFACAKPVVASDLPNLRPFIKDAQTGFSAKLGDADDFAAKIKEILDNPSDAKLMGQRALALVRASYDWNKIVDELEQIYAV